MPAQQSERAVGGVLEHVQKDYGGDLQVSPKELLDETELLSAKPKRNTRNF